MAREWCFALALVASPASAQRRPPRVFPPEYNENLIHGCVDRARHLADTPEIAAECAAAHALAERCLAPSRAALTPQAYNAAFNAYMACSWESSIALSRCEAMRFRATVEAREQCVFLLSAGPRFRRGETPP